MAFLGLLVGWFGLVLGGCGFVFVLFVVVVVWGGVLYCKMDFP